MRMLLALMAASLALGLAPYGFLLEHFTHGGAAGDNYGTVVAGGGDLNADGLADHVITSIFEDSAASAAGAAYVRLGRAPASAAPDLVLLGEAADDQFGVSAALGGDVNGDDFGDLVVGARFSDRAGKDTGSVFVYFGAPSPGAPGGMDATPDLILTGEAMDDWFGTSVDVAGDVNGDGFDDLVAGAPYNDQAGSAAGKAYIFLGGSSPDTAPDVALLGDAQDDGHFGWSVSGAGDVNADGFADVIVGARLYGSGPTRAVGRAYIFLGGPAMDGVADVILTGENRDDWFGSAVSGIGDFNGDGVDDVAVGAIFWDDLSNPLQPKSAAGRVYVYYGSGGIMDAAPDWTVSGERADDQLGSAIAPAGDVDANGADDLIVGARFHDNLSGTTAPAAGKIYLFGGRGGGSPGTEPLFTRLGQAADDQFGSSVAGAGDSNRDGLAEFLAGAHFADIAGPGSGSAMLSFLDCLDLDVAGETVVWGGCGVHDQFDLLRGRPEDLPGGSFGVCLAAGTMGPPLSDPEVPPPGGIFTYLVAGGGTSPQTSIALGFGSSGEGRLPQPPCD